MSAYIILTLIGIPILAGLTTYNIKHENIRETLTLCLSLISFLLTLYLTINYKYSNYLELTTTLININSAIHITLSFSESGLLFATMVSMLWVISTIYSIGYMRLNNERNQGRFYAFFSFSIAGTLGIALSSNLLTLLLFYEILTFTTFPLVAHNLNSENKKQVLTYIYILTFTSLFLFTLAVILVFLYTGTSDFTKGGLLQYSDISPFATIILVMLFIFGVAKAAVMPVHAWLPAAMVAPTPVSALLHAVAVVKGGAFALYKIIVFIFGIDYLKTAIYSLSDFNWLVIIPSITIIIASLIAMYQDDLKKLAAYSTIGQLSYIVLGLLVLTDISVQAAYLHIFAHAFSKITIFFAIGSIIVLTNKKKVSELSGIGKKIPITMIAFALGALSLIGFPLLAGFVSKWYLIIGILSSGEYFTLIVLLLSTMLNGIYFLPILFKAFFRDSISDHKIISSKSMNTAMILSSLLIILFGCIGTIYLIELAT